MVSVITAEKPVLRKGNNHHQESGIDFNFLKKAFFTLRSVSHPLRKKILHLLEEHRRLAVTEIYVKLRVPQSVASQHLSVLRASGTVRTEREGKFVYYSLNKGRVLEIAHLIEELAEAEA